MSYSPTSASDALTQLTAEETLEFDQIIADGVTHNVNDFATKEDIFALFLTAGTVYVRNTQAPTLWYLIGDNIASNVASATKIVDSLNGVNSQVMTLSKQLTPAMEAALSNSGANVGSAALAPITNTELAVQSTGKTLQITTKGILTKIPYSKALTAGAAALGVGLGIGFVESNPGLATQISNRIFGTDIDPSEIANIVENTTVWANIVDGATFLAEDFIDAIKDVFIENDVYSISGPNEWGSHRVDNSLDCTYVIATALSGAVCKYKFYPNLIEGESITPNEIIYGLQTTYAGGVSFQPYTRMGGFVANRIGARWVYGNYSQDLTNELPGGYVVIQQLSNPTVIDGNTWRCSFDGSARPYGYFRIVSITSWGKYRVAWRDTWTDTRSVVEWMQDLVSGIGLPAISIPDVELEDGATYPDSSKTLAQDYPDWWDKRTSSKTISDDSESTREWLQVNTSDPTSQEDAQDGEMKDSSQLEDAIGGIEDSVDENQDIDSSYDPQEQPYPNPNPEPGSVLTPVTPAPPGIDNSDGTSPDPTVPILTTVVTSGLSYIYNPTLAQTKQLGQKLWTLDFVENLKKIFVDPMQAIIGLHVLYATPKTGSVEDIVLGFYNTEVQSKIVTNQYVTIDCGRISVNEYFKDARDYEPYTKVSAYLPFIGVVDLKADDIINSYVNIIYNIDVLTGTCLGIIKVIKGNAEAAIYQYVGNCAVSVPLSTGNYTAVLTALLSVASSAVGGAAIGGVAGAAFGGLKGAAINASRAKLNVQQSGNLGANAGALGIRTPYLIIRRPVTNDAYAYNMQYGYPAHKWKKLGGCSGFTRVRSVHLDNIKCTDEEKEMIEEALKDGVIL